VILLVTRLISTLLHPANPDAISAGKATDKQICPLNGDLLRPGLSGLSAPMSVLKN
jgi:hypothetical protein